MVSFDVLSLFTNVPTEEACKITKDGVDSDPTLADHTALSPSQITDLIHLCVSSNYPVPRQILQADGWDFHGIPYIPSPSQYLHGRI